MKLLTILMSVALCVACTKRTDAPEEVKKSERGLAVGEMAPPITSVDIDGAMFELEKEVTKGPVVLVFYRGGWCPYCSLQLRNLQADALPDVKKAGGRLIAISVDKLDSALKTKEKEKLGMTILSDPKAEILKLYDVDYVVPADLVEKYVTKYKIDLEAHSGEKHHTIAVPAVYVIDKSRKITFSYVNEDYKTRAQITDILKAVEAL